MMSLSSMRPVDATAWRGRDRQDAKGVGTGLVWVILGAVTAGVLFWLFPGADALFMWGFGVLFAGACLVGLVLTRRRRHRE